MTHPKRTGWSDQVLFDTVENGNGGRRAAAEDGIGSRKIADVRACTSISIIYSTAPVVLGPSPDHPRSLRRAVWR
jgi:hypothetical protein